MGYNTVMVVLNDNVDFGAKDPELGQRILNAVHSWNAREYRGDSVLDVYTHHNTESGGSITASYGSVISQDHADWPQVVVVQGNCGWRICEEKYDKHLGYFAFDQMKSCLERNGYRVTKRRKVKVKD